MTKQDYRSPKNFIDAISERFGVPTFDLAATRGEQIHTALAYYTPEQDSLKQSWASLSEPTFADDAFGGNKHFAWHRVVYLNPPFKRAEPWAEKLAAECRFLRRWTLMLTPASIGTEWFAKHLDGKVLTLGLRPRLTFEGTPDPYPKDLMLLCAGFGVSGFGTWNWSDYTECSCGHSDIEDPGPGHAPACPWTDPNFTDGGL